MTTDAWPNFEQGVWQAGDVAMQRGGVLADARLFYRAFGNPDGPRVLMLHGTMGQGSDWLAPSLAGPLFGAGGPLDASRYRILLPDALGSGQSSKPSDSLRGAFPAYGYRDMVMLQQRWVQEHQKVDQLEAVIGFSMGGMHAWLWATMFADAMRLVVPLAATPAQMSGRNWATRRMLIETIRQDPSWQQGFYNEQPHALRWAWLTYGISTNGGDQGWHQRCPDIDHVDAWVDQKLQQPLNLDANDLIWQVDAARDYDPAADLSRIRAQVLAINSSDDERNPPSLGTLEAAIAKVPNARHIWVPGSGQTHGHISLLNAALWADELAAVMR